MALKRWCRTEVALAACGLVIMSSAFQTRTTPEPTTALSAPDTTLAFTPADVEFVQGMIQHHAQALVMAALVASRTRNNSIRSLARRIDISQRDEIRLMDNWLIARNQSVPAAELHPSADLAPGMQMDMPGMLMPGMLTQQQLAQLA